MAWPLGLLAAGQRGLSAALLQYFLVSRFKRFNFLASPFSVFVPFPLPSPRFGLQPCFLYADSKLSKHLSQDRDKTCLLQLPFACSLSERGYPEIQEMGLSDILPRCKPSSTSVPSRSLPVSRIPSLISGRERATWDILARGELTGSQTILTPQSLAHHLPGLLPSTSSRNLSGPTASKLRQLRPSRRHCPLRRGSAPPSRQVSPVAQPGPALRTGQHPADPAPLPFPRSNWTPHTPLHTMLLQVNRALPQHPDGHTRPLCSVILKPPQSGDLRARPWPAPAKRKASHLPCSPALPKRLQFSAQAHAALPLRRRSQPRLAAGALRRRSIGTLLQRTGKLAQSWALRVQCGQAPFSSEARRLGPIVISLGSCCCSVALRLRTLWKEAGRTAPETPVPGVHHAARRTTELSISNLLKGAAATFQLHVRSA